MNLQVLVVTMNQSDHKLLEKMKINSDAVVGNQCGHTYYEEFKYKENNIKWYNSNAIGVGHNRNTVLLNADADIVLFADDDVVYESNYKEKVLNEYKKHPEADLMIFNVKLSRNNKPFKNTVTKNRYIKKHAAGRYGTYCISAKRNSLLKKNIWFHMMFGGGAKYCSGEDTIFLQECLKKGLKLYSSTCTIGTVNHGESTWYKGYNDQYFIDRGILYAYLYPEIAPILSVYHIVKHRKIYGNQKILHTVGQMLCGVKQGRELFYGK